MSVSRQSYLFLTISMSSYSLYCNTERICHEALLSYVDLSVILHIITSKFFGVSHLFVGCPKQTAHDFNALLVDHPSIATNTTFFSKKAGYELQEHMLLKYHAASSIQNVDYYRELYQEYKLSTFFMGCDVLLGSKIILGYIEFVCNFNTGKISKLFIHKDFNFAQAKTNSLADFLTIICEKGITYEIIDSYKEYGKRLLKHGGIGAYVIKDITL